MLDAPELVISSDFINACSARASTGQADSSGGWTCCQGVFKPIGNNHAVNAYIGTDVVLMLVWTVHWVSTDNCTKGQCRGGYLHLLWLSLIGLAVRAILHCCHPKRIVQHQNQNSEVTHPIDSVKESPAGQKTLQHFMASWQARSADACALICPPLNHSEAS